MDMGRLSSVAAPVTATTTTVGPVGDFATFAAGLPRWRDDASHGDTTGTGAGMDRAEAFESSRFWTSFFRDHREEFERASNRTQEEEDRDDRDDVSTIDLAALDHDQLLDTLHATVGRLSHELDALRESELLRSARKTAQQVAPEHLSASMNDTRASAMSMEMARLQPHAETSTTHPHRFTRDAFVQILAAHDTHLDLINDPPSRRSSIVAATASGIDLLNGSFVQAPSPTKTQPPPPTSSVEASHHGATPTFAYISSAHLRVYSPPSENGLNHDSFLDSRLPADVSDTSSFRSIDSNDVDNIFGDGKDESLHQERTQQDQYPHQQQQQQMLSPAHILASGQQATTINGVSPGDFFREKSGALGRLTGSPQDPSQKPRFESPYNPGVFSTQTAIPVVAPSAAGPAPAPTRPANSAERQHNLKTWPIQQSPGDLSSREYFHRWDAGAYHHTSTSAEKPASMTSHTMPQPTVAANSQTKLPPLLPQSASMVGPTHMVDPVLHQPATHQPMHNSGAGKGNTMRVLALPSLSTSSNARDWSDTSSSASSSLVDENSSTTIGKLRATTVATSSMPPRTDSFEKLATQSRSRMWPTASRVPVSRSAAATSSTDVHLGRTDLFESVDPPFSTMDISTDVPTHDNQAATVSSLPSHRSLPPILHLEPTIKTESVYTSRSSTGAQVIVLAPTSAIMDLGVINTTASREVVVINVGTKTAFVRLVVKSVGHAHSLETTVSPSSMTLEPSSHQIVKVAIHTVTTGRTTSNGDRTARWMVDVISIENDARSRVSAVDTSASSQRMSVPTQVHRFEVTASAPAAPLELYEGDTTASLPSHDSESREWHVSPRSLGVPANEPTPTTWTMVITNTSTSELAFEVAWPAAHLDVFPAFGRIPANAGRKLSVTPLNLAGRMHDWRGRISVTIGDEVQFISVFIASAVPATSVSAISNAENQSSLAGAPASLSLSGGILKASPSVNFPATTVGRQSERFIIVENSSSNGVTITIDPCPSSAFEVSSTMVPSVLPPQSTQQIPVRFNPNVEGRYESHIDLKTSSGHCLRCFVFGVAVLGSDRNGSYNQDERRPDFSMGMLQADCPVIDYGSVSYGSAPIVRYVKIQNFAGHNCNVVVCGLRQDEGLFRISEEHQVIPLRRHQFVKIPVTLVPPASAWSSSPGCQEMSVIFVSDTDPQPVYVTLRASLTPSGLRQSMP